MMFLELFSGTGEHSQGIRKARLGGRSLDISNEFHLTIQADIVAWDYTCYPPGYCDCIWSSPCCINYCRARTGGGPRDLVGADKLVQQTFDIVSYFKPHYFWIENPWIGLLKTRPLIQHLNLFI